MPKIILSEDEVKGAIAQYLNRNRLMCDMTREQIVDMVVRSPAEKLSHRFTELEIKIEE